MPQITLHTIKRSVLIKAGNQVVWNVLTDPALMKEWLSDSDLEIYSERKEGGHLLFKGDLHGVDYEDKGTLLIFDPGRVLRYTHLSKISNLPDLPENYSVITFYLESSSEGTHLRLEQTNFVTESIFKHWEFYWNVTLGLIKQVCETLEVRN